MKIGIEEGERCNRQNEDGFACDGEMMLDEVENCSCHISAPCGQCIENAPVYSVCGEASEAE